MAEPWIHRELKRLLTERDRLAGAVRELIAWSRKSGPPNRKLDELQTVIDHARAALHEIGGGR